MKWILQGPCVCLMLLLSTKASALTYYSRASGNWNVAANWSQATYGGAASATYPGQAGAGDIVYISGHVITVTATPPFALAGITLNQLGASSTTKLDLNTAAIVLTCTGFTMLENNVNQDMDLEVSSTATFQVNGAFGVTRGAANNRNKRMRVYARNSGIINVSGDLTWSYARSNGETQQEILLDNSGRINVGGAFLATIGNNVQNGDEFEMEMNNTSQLNVTGTSTFDILNTNDGDDMLLDLNGGTFTSGGLMTWRTSATATGSSSFTTEIDGASVVAQGGLTMDHKAGSTMDLLLNSNSTTTAASLAITGDMIVSHTGGDDQQIEMNSNSTVTVTGDMPMTLNVTDGDYQYLDLNNGTFTVTGDLTENITGAGSQRLDIQIDGSAQLNVNNDLNIHQQTGGPLHFYVNSNSGTNAQVNIGRDLIIDHEGAAEEVELDLYQGSTLSTGRDLSCYNTPNGGDYLWLRFHDAPTVSVGRDLNMIMDAGTNVDDDLIIRQYGGAVSVGRNLTFTKSAGDEVYWNQDGGTTTVAGDLTFNSTGGGDNWLYLDNASQLAITGDLLFNSDAGDETRLWMNEVSGTGAHLTVGGDLIFDHEAAADDLLFYMNRGCVTSVNGDLLWQQDCSAGDYGRIRTTNQTVSLSVGGDMIIQLLSGTNANDDFEYDQQGGAVTVGGNASFELNGGDDMYAHVHNLSSFDITGDLSLKHPGGDDLKFDQSSNNSWVYVDGDVIMTDNAGGGTPTEWEQDNQSNSRILGDFSMTATAGSQCLIDMNNSSYMEIAGSIVRQAAPNHFGTLTAAALSTIEFNGTANTQVITDDAGNGGDSFHYEKVRINNTFATYPQLSTEGTVSIWNAITFTDGVVYTEPTSVLVIPDGSTSTVGNAGSFVDGPMKKIGTAAFTFPVGDNGYWARLGMQNPVNYGTTTEFTCEYHDVPAPNNLPANYGVGIDHVSYVEYWDLARTFDFGNNASCNVRLYWQDNVRSGIDVTQLADLRASHFRSTTNKWENQGGTGAGGAAGSVTSTTPLTAFSPITFGSAGGANDLPVELVEFEARLNGSMVDLFWTTASEMDNDHFEVERSVDGVSFSTIATVAGAGNSQEELHYAVLDPVPAQGSNFYRLKQVDTNNSFTYSDVRTIYMSFSNGVVPVLFPNPGLGDLNVAIDLDDDADATFELRDASGHEVLHERHVMARNSVVSLRTAHLPAGSYIMNVSIAGEPVGAARWLKMR